MADLPNDVVQALEEAVGVADAAVEMLDRYPAVYRVPILVSLLKAASTLRTATRAPSVAPDPGGYYEIVDRDTECQLEPLSVVADVAGVDQVDLERIVHLEEDGRFKLLLPVEGRSKAERATRAAALYCFIKQHGFDERDAGTEELRRLCIEQQAYDAPNFTRNLQKSRWLLVIGKPRSRNKKYRLSVHGEEEAKTILRELLGAGEFVHQQWHLE